MAFDVLFQKWLKVNSGKTYDDSIKAYYQMFEDKKLKKPLLINNLNTILLLDFFAENKRSSSSYAIKC